MVMLVRGLAVVLVSGLTAGGVLALPSIPAEPAAAVVTSIIAKKKLRPAPAAAPKPVIDPAQKAQFQAHLAKAEAGDRFAMYNVAYAYRQGEGVSKNEPAALMWYQRRDEATIKAAEGGDTDAMSEAVALYESGGNGFAADAKKSQMWEERRRDAFFDKARTGNAEAMVALAGMLDSPQVGPADHQGALAWWRKAAEAGSYEAMRTLAGKYDDGIDVPADRAEAFRWYQKAAGDGSDPWSARIALAQKYKTGDGTTKNVDEAARLHVMIAEGYGGWRRRMRAESFADDVARSEKAYRRAVQHELSGRGLYAGTIDGEPSDALSSAIKKVWRSKVSE